MTILGAPYTGVPPTGEFVLPPYLSDKGGGEDEDSDDAEVPPLFLCLPVPHIYIRHGD
jgi:hypothetical protein